MLIVKPKRTEPVIAESEGDTEAISKLTALEQQFKEMSQRLPTELPVDVQMQREKLQTLSEQINQVTQDKAALDQLRQSLETLGQKVTQPLVRPTQSDPAEGQPAAAPSTEGAAPSPSN